MSELFPETSDIESERETITINSYDKEENIINNELKDSKQNNLQNNNLINQFIEKMDKLEKKMDDNFQKINDLIKEK